MAAGVLCLYLIVVLATYDRGDPGWSHEAASDVVANAGGWVGARRAAE